MEFVKVMEIKKRMCSSTKCNVCPLGKQISEGVTYCPDFIGEFPSRAEQILIEWDKAHPVKTFLSDFLEKHPKTTLWNQGFPYGCPKYYGYIDMDSDCVVDSEGNPDCLTCWNRPLHDSYIFEILKEDLRRADNE